MKYIKKSFYDWCIENNHNEILELWDNDKNSISPKEVACTSSKSFYFKCLKKSHESILYKLSNIYQTGKISCKFCNSFGIWCKETGNEYILDMWDYSNNKSYFDVSKKSGKKIIFLCKKNPSHPSFSATPADIASGKYKKIKCPVCNSVGQYIEDTFGKENFKNVWSDNNEVDAYKISLSSDKYIWIKCQEKNYHPDYQIPAHGFSAGNRCPWCASKKIHPKDSFAQYNIDRLGSDFLQKYWCEDNSIDPWELPPFSNDIKVKMQCQTVSYHKYEVRAANFSRGTICPYCNKKQLDSRDSLGAKYKNILPIWSDKNNKTPFQYKCFSHEKVWLKCRLGIHEDYLQQISTYTKSDEYSCPKCSHLNVSSSLERKVYDFLTTNTNYTINTERRCTLLPINPNTHKEMPYDNEVLELKLIIEVHGSQHYKLSGFHAFQSKQKGTTPEQEFSYQKWKDLYKKDFALENGYHFLEISYLDVKNGNFKTLITEKINNICSEKP